MFSKFRRAKLLGNYEPIDLKFPTYLRYTCVEGTYDLYEKLNFSKTAPMQNATGIEKSTFHVTQKSIQS